MSWPSYAELMSRADAPPGSSWGLFGAGDELGTLNFIGPEQRLRAAGCVRRGAVFNLDHRLDGFPIPPAAHRGVPRHRIFANSPHHRDDVVDNLYPQATSQIDGLRHFAHPRHGFYNDTDASRIREGTPDLGINRYAEAGIFGRGIVIDIDRHLRKNGAGPLDHAAGEAFGVELLDNALADSGTDLQPGDIVLMRTGWLDYYFNTLDDDGRRQVSRDLRSPGLKQHQETLAWLWDNRIAMIASDNAGIEAVPVVADSQFRGKEHQAIGGAGIHRGMIHPILLALLGFALGELWDLEALAADCAEDGCHECLIAAKPLNLTGGVGSPANAMAIK